jgi:tetratricopeptide (TPR) repeat protein
MLARNSLKRDDPATALAVAGEYARRFPANDTLALLRAKAFLLTGQYWAAAELLESLHVLPAEGTTEAHALFREARLLLAVGRLQTGAFADALRLVGLARQWPEQLGAGKPYPADVDERLEDWLTAQCYVALKDPVKARQSLDRILVIHARPQGQGIGDLIRAMALRQSGRLLEAEKFLHDWQAHDAGSDLAKWGAEFFAGRPAPLTASLQGLDCRVLAGIALAGFHPEPLPRE